MRTTKIIIAIAGLFALASCDAGSAPREGNIEIIYEDENVVIKAGQVKDTDFETQYPNFKRTAHGLTSQISLNELSLFSTAMPSYPRPDIEKTNQFRILSQSQSLDWEISPLSRAYSWANNQSEDEIAIYDELVKKCEQVDRGELSDLFEDDPYRPGIQHEWDPNVPYDGPKLRIGHEGLEIIDLNGLYPVKPISCDQYVAKHTNRYLLELNGTRYLLTSFVTNYFEYRGNSFRYFNFARRVK